MKNLCEALMDFLISQRWQEKKEGEKVDVEGPRKNTQSGGGKKEESSMEFGMGLDKNRRNELEN